jgi:hypothetical protein
MIQGSIPFRIHAFPSFLLLIFSVACLQCAAAEKSTVLEKSVVNLSTTLSPIKPLSSENYTNRLGVKSIFIGDSLDNVKAIRSIKIRCIVSVGDTKFANADSSEMSQIREKQKTTTAGKDQFCTVDGIATVGGLYVKSFEVEFFDNKALRILITFERKYQDKLKYDEQAKLDRQKLTAFLDALTLHFQIAFTQRGFCEGNCRFARGGTFFTRYAWETRDGRAIFDDYASYSKLTISSPQGDSRSAARTAMINKMTAESRVREEYEKKQEQELKKSNAARAVARDL